MSINAARGAAHTVLAGLPGLSGPLEAFYRDLHAHPELSHAETNTAAKVAGRLSEVGGFDIHDQIGGTGVVAILVNGDGPTVLVRADMDALPVEEATGLDYASTVITTDADGNQVPVMHACGHDVHVTCLLGAAELLARSRDQWSGTLVALFQPAEETGDGAQGMTDELTKIVSSIDVALGQHVLAFPAGSVLTRPGPVLTEADSMKITVYGRGAHGSMPQAAIDPVVLAAMIVIRLQTVVSREIAPSDTAVLTVGSIRAGSKSNVIPDRAEIQLNLRTYSDATRRAMLTAIRRIVIAECEASDSPREPDFELFDHFPLTDNDPDATGRVSEAFAGFFGDRAASGPPQSASEDFSDLPNAFGAPYCYWFIGGIDPKLYRQAEQAGRVAQDVPVNHSAAFAPVIEPTLEVGTQTLVVAALAWLQRPAG